jgi:hypothetical protein
MPDGEGADIRKGERLSATAQSEVHSKCEKCARLKIATALIGSTEVTVRLLGCCCRGGGLRGLSGAAANENRGKCEHEQSNQVKLHQ